MSLATPQRKSASPKGKGTSRGAPPGGAMGAAPGTAAGAATALPRFLAAAGALGIQRKVLIGRQDDPFEQEADAVADAVQRGEPAPVPAAGATPPPLQRKCAQCAEEQDQEKPAASPPAPDRLLQRAMAAGTSGTAGGSGHAGGGAAGVAHAVARPSAGSPLAPTVRGPLESSLGTDLGHVRVHSDAAAHGLAGALQAKAFTHGAHIWLGERQQADDLPLMAHEVAHVVQQGSGRARPDAVQRAPADYRHPEDGGEVLGRMQARIASAREGHEDEQPTGDADAQAHAARSAATQVDRGEMAQQRAELEPASKPAVDRPAVEAPKVQQAQAQTEQEADSPAEPLAEGEGEATKGEGQGEGAEAGGGAKAQADDGGAGQAQQAFGRAAAVPMPMPEMPVLPPLPVSVPTDAGGQPLPGDADADTQVAGLAQQAQSLREEGARQRALATEERRNATTLRGNLALVQGGVAQAELGVERSRDHLGFRQELLGQAQGGLEVSEQKAATVAAEAPGFASKADEGKAESGPMASEATDMASQNAANTPDDEDAAARAREQGSGMNQAAGDIGTTDDAVTQTRAKAGSLGEEAAQAQETNQATRGQLGAMQETLAATSGKLDQMGEQSAQARGRMEALADAPDTHAQQASLIDERGGALVRTSQGMETRLQAVQSDYAAGMAAVPAAEPWTPEKVAQVYGEDALLSDVPADAGSAALPGEGGPALLVQRTPEDGSPADLALPPDAAADAPDAGVPPAAGLGDAGAPADMATDLAPPAADGAVEPPADAGAAGPDAALADAAGPPPPAAAAPPERARVDATGAVAGALPSWLTGVEPPNEEARQQAAQAAAERRAAQIAEIEGESGNGFASMTATDRMGWALRQTGRNLFGSVSGIKWPGFGHLALGLIDPRGPMMGVVSGLGMMLSGGANLFSAEQWRRDPLGNLLKSAADIATGLTIVLGSITALAGVIIAIMTAITILSFGTAAPVTGPVIAFCTTVLTTVGGWTIAVGKVALVLQALVLIKNLIDAACAQSAAELQSEADQMTENVGDAANVLMQMGMAKAGQLGARSASAEISAAGGGVRYAAQMGARAGVTARAGVSAAGRGLRALPSAAVRGARALPGALARGARAAPGALARGARAAPGALGRGVVAGGRALARGTLAAGRAVGRGTLAAGRAVGRGVTAAARGVRALPGAVARGVRGLPGAVRGLPGAVRALPGRLARGARESVGSGLSRGFLVGEDIANLGMARSAAADARAAVWAEARAPGGALAAESRAAAAAQDTRAAGTVAGEAPVPGSGEAGMPGAAETRARVQETPAAAGAEREVSVSRSSHLESEQITPQQAANEVAHVDAHPELVEGRAPNQRARIGEHEIVEVPGGGCVRHSNGGLPIPCPVSFGPRQQALYDDFMQGLEREGVSTESTLRRFGFASEEELRAFVAEASSERDLVARLRDRLVSGGSDDALAAERRMLSGSREALDEANLAPTDIEGMAQSSHPDRFDWRTTEDELALEQARSGLPPQEWRTQRPVRGGQVVDRGRVRRGDTIPERYHPGSGRRRAVSLEAKNYLLDDAAVLQDPTLMRDFLERVADQARRRATQLPPGARQIIVIDLRGQVVSSATRAGIARDLFAMSDGAVRPSNIRFINGATR